VAGDTNGLCDIFVHDRQTGETTLVSVDSLGNQANGDSFVPSISADGRFVAFLSAASNLVAGDTNADFEAFVHDRLTGQTVRVNVDSLGNQGNAGELAGVPQVRAALSGDGRFVAFSSFSSNLVPGDTNGTNDIFVHDRQTGQTTRVSVDSNGTEANGPSDVASISADGRFVAFRSLASNLVSGDTNNFCDINGDLVFTDNCPDVFVHDRQTGQTTRVSVDSNGVEGNGESFASSSGMSLSADGRFVAFSSEASNLVPGDTNGIRDVFVHDRQAGTTTRVSVDSAGNQGTTAVFSGAGVAISADGRFVAFEFDPPLVAEDTNGRPDVFVHDRATGETTLASVDSAGNGGNGSSVAPAISADGRFVSFVSGSDNLVAGDTNNVPDVFVHDRRKAPSCGAAVASPGDLWPPNRRLVEIAIEGVLDADGNPVTITVTSVRQDEPVNATGAGAGRTTPDATLNPLSVRAERNGTGNGRVYHIGFSAEDSLGVACAGVVLVCVRHDQRPGGSCGDEGPMFDSLVP
jgi:Tol biopolymer transport system component